MGVAHDFIVGLSRDGWKSEELLFKQISQPPISGIFREYYSSCSKFSNPFPHFHSFMSSVHDNYKKLISIRLSSSAYPRFLSLTILHIYLLSDLFETLVRFIS